MRSVIAIATVFAIMAVVTVALPSPQATQLPVKYSPQVVLQFNSTLPDGDISFVPKGTLILRVRPMNGAKAPMELGQLLVCRAGDRQVAIKLVSGVNLGPYNEITFRCGTDEYLFDGLDVHEESHK